MPLKKLPASFDLKFTMGDFPNFFNKPENYEYEGSIPGISYYGADSMSISNREEFLKWHASQKNVKFIFKEELLKYCRGDVNVLREGCMKFRKMILEVTSTNIQIDNETGLLEYIGGIDAFSSTTLAGLCLNVFRAKFLPESYAKLPTVPDDSNIDIEVLKDDLEPSELEAEVVGKKKEDKFEFDKTDIGLIPPGGYSYDDQYSYKSILWLELYSYRKKVRVQHALNGGEFRVPDTGYRLDGYISETNTAL
jgi:hypothetical protein